MRRLGIQRRGGVQHVPVNPVADTVTITPAGTVNMGNTDTHTATAVFSDSTNGNAVVTVGYTAEWTSLTPSVLIVDRTTGVVTVVPGASGNATLRVQDTGHTVTGLQSYVVTAPQSSPASITLSASAQSLTVPATFALTATVKDALAQILTGQTVTSFVNNTSIATVGAVTGDPVHSMTVSSVAAGSTQVTVSCGAITATCFLTIAAAPPVGVTTWYQCTLGVANYPGYLVATPGPSALQQAPYATPNFITATMLADQSGHGGTIDSLYPYNPLSASGTPSTEQWQAHGERTPVVQPDVLSPTGYSIRTHIDAAGANGTTAGNDQQRGVNFRIASSVQKMRIRTYYRFTNGFNWVAANSTSNGHKWNRVHHIAPSQDLMLLNVLRVSGAAKFNFAVIRPNEPSVNANHLANVGPANLQTPIFDGTFHYTDFQTDLSDPLNPVFQTWHDGTLIMNYTIPLTQGAWTMGLNLVKMFDTFNIPSATYDYYWLPPIITDG